MSQVTVIVPCFNGLQFLEECLRSVVAQTFADWRLIVVDDASTTGDPGDAIRAVGDARIELLRHASNRGLGAARNTGFAAATSPLVLPLDADDLLDARFLENLCGLLRADDSLDCAFADFDIFGTSTGARNFTLKPLAALACEQWLPGSGVLMKRELWQRAGGYSEDAIFRLGNEDWDFWLSAAEVGFRAIHLPEPLYRYRQHGASMSVHVLRPADHRTRRLIVRRHRSFLAQHSRVRLFLAEGYWRAADASRSERRALRSIWLSVRALLLAGQCGRFRDLLRNNVSDLLPPKARAQAKAILRFARPRASR